APPRTPAYILRRLPNRRMADLICESRRLRPGGTRLAHAIQEESVLSGVETVLSCDLTKAMQRCANPIQRVTVNTLRHVPWLCSLAPLRYSSQGRPITMSRFWLSLSRPRTGIRKRACAAASDQMWR